MPVLSLGQKRKGRLSELQNDPFQLQRQALPLLSHSAKPPTAATAAAGAASAQDDSAGRAALDARWVRGTRLVRVTGFGPLFDEGAYEQDGHVRIDFGNDAPFLEEEAELNSVAARHMEENVRQLVELTTGVEKASGRPCPRRTSRRY